MRYTAHIPVESFGFVSAEWEPEEGRNVADVYREISAMFKPSEGVDEKTMNAFVDNMLLANGKNDINTYNEMSQVQKNTVQILKRGLKRITRNEE